MSLYELIYTILIEVGETSTDSTRIYASILFLSFILVRVSGIVWSWAALDNRNCKDLRFAISHRMSIDTDSSTVKRRMLAIDEKLIRWFQRHRRIKSLAGMVALNLTFASVSYVLNSKAMPFLSIRDDIAGNLPSLRFCSCGTNKGADMKCAETTTVRNLLLNLDSTNLSSSLASNVELAPLQDRLNMEDDAYVWSRASKVSYFALNGDATSAVVSTRSLLLLYSFNVLVSSWILGKLGVEFSDMWF